MLNKIGLKIAKKVTKTAVKTVVKTAVKTAIKRIVYPIAWKYANIAAEKLYHKTRSLIFPKKIVFIGIGKMGRGMCENLLAKDYTIYGFDSNHKNMNFSEDNKKYIKCISLKDSISRVKPQRIIWLMLPANVVGKVVNEIKDELDKGDIIIDGGNSYYKDSIKIYNELKKKGIHFIDCGTSSGVSGARNGACMMIGGDREIFERIEFLIKDMCAKDAYYYTGKSGSGHYVKMVHNAIEYGMIASINEGFNALAKSPFGLNLGEIAKVYSNGSILEGKLIKLTSEVYADKKFFNELSSKVPIGATEGEMKKLTKEADMRILHEALVMRERSRKSKYDGKLISALRNKFGGHDVIKK